MIGLTSVTTPAGGPRWHIFCLFKLLERKAMNGDEAVFDSTRSALVFAFGFRTQQYGETPLAKLQRHRLGSGRGLVGMDGAGQAGMVLAQIDRLGPTDRAVIIARFAPRFEPCPCCGGERPIAIWREAIEHLAACCIPSGVSNFRCRRDLVAKYFGVVVRIDDLAGRYAMSRNTVSGHYRIMARQLSDMESIAHVRADDVLINSGMVYSGA